MSQILFYRPVGTRKKNPIYSDTGSGGQLSAEYYYIALSVLPL